MKRLILVFFIICSLHGVARQPNYRKAIQKSDLIFSSNEYMLDTVRENDFTKVLRYRIDSIDTIIKRSVATLPKELLLRGYVDNEDYYSDLVISGGGCVLNTMSFNADATYRDLFFVRKAGKEYQAFLVLKGLEWDKYNSIVHQITTMASISNSRSDKERFDKTLDWFIDNGFVPDDDFVDFYKMKGIITDSVHYSEERYQKALLHFEAGQEELFSIVKNKYPAKVMDYYVDKMNALISKEALGFTDYYDFYRIVVLLTDDFGNDYDSANYILNTSLTSEGFEEHEKRRIMEILLAIVKEWKPRQE